jgi:hypothetical protein
MMTLAVHRLDRDGHRREVLRKYEVAPLRIPEFTSKWPPCQCFMCRRVKRAK